MISLPHTMQADDGLYPFVFETRAVRRKRLRGDLKAMAAGALSALILIAVVAS